MKTVAFIPQNNSYWQFPIPLCVLDWSLGGGSHNPDVTFFQLLYQSYEIRDTGHGNILKRTGRDLGNYLCQSCRPSLWNKYTVNTGAFGCSQDRAHITRILNPIQPQDQRRIFAAHLCLQSFQQFVSIGVTGRSDFRHHALVSDITQRTIQLYSWNSANGHSQLPRKFKEVLQPFRLSSFHDCDFFDLSFACTQCLEHGNESVDEACCRGFPRFTGITARITTRSIRPKWTTTVVRLSNLHRDWFSEFTLR